MLHVGEDIPSNLIDSDDKPIESLLIELNLQNTKILINCLDLHSSQYDKILILGDFQVQIKEANMKLFCENYNLKSVIKEPTCYKNPNKSTCIDLILTNVARMFQSKCVTETGLSHFNLMTVAVIRKIFKIRLQ